MSISDCNCNEGAYTPIIIFLAKSAAWVPTCLKLPEFHVLSMVQIVFWIAIKCAVTYARIFLVSKGQPKYFSSSATSSLSYKHTPIYGFKVLTKSYTSYMNLLILSTFKWQASWSAFGAN